MGKYRSFTARSAPTVLVAALIAVVGTGTAVVLAAAPTDIQLSNTSIPENSGGGTPIGNLSTTDPDAGDTFTYTKAAGSGSADNASFNIVGDELRAASNFNFEVKNSYSVRLRSTDNGGAFTEKKFTITVTNVNDTPTNIALSKASVAENTPQGTDVGNLSTTDEDVPGQSFTYALVPGGGATDNSSFQITGSTLEVKNPLDFEAGATRSVRIRTTDDGAPNRSFQKQFTITVTNVNDAPVTTVPGAQSVNEDTDLTFSAANSNPISTSDADAGPDDIRVILGAIHGTLTLATTAGLTPPINDGTMNVTVRGTVAEVDAALDGLRYRGNLNYAGPDTLSVNTSDLGHNPGPALTDSDSVAITVNPVNDAPVAGDNVFNEGRSAVGNTTLVGNDPTDGAPATSDPHKAITGDILANDSDVDGPGPLTVINGTFATSDGGSVTIQSDGDFTFHPAAGTSCTDGSDSFDYTVKDNGAPNRTDSGTVTIAISNCVWYVSNNGAGNSGTSSAPFNTLAQAEAASGTGDTVFLFDGDNTTTGYAAGFTLNNDERLIGAAASLVVGSVNLRPATPADRPTITDNNADVVALASGNVVRGLAIDPQGAGGGIAGSAGDNSGTIDDVRVIDLGTAGTQPGLELNGTSGTFDVSNLVVDNSAATGQAGGSIGVSLANAGTVNFKPAGKISITSKGAAGLNVLGTGMGTSAFDDIKTAGSGSGAVSIVNATGTTTLGDGGTDLNLTTTSGPTPALRLSTAGTVNVGEPGTDDVSATGGPAVAISGSSGAAYDFDAVKSTNSATDGISLSGLGAANFSADSGPGTSITGAAGTSFNLNGGSGTIDYPGNLNNGPGQTASVTNRAGGAVTLSGQINDSADAGGGIVLTSDSGGSTTFSNPTQKINTTTAGSPTQNNAVVMSASNGHTLKLTGGALDIDTATGKGLEADNSGAIKLTGASNTINTTTGRAVNISDTDIGASGVTLQRVSSNGAANGIRLNNTANGAFTVTGTGTGTSGGTIQGSTGSGVSLNAVPGGVSLTRMAVTGSGDDGIDGSTVNGLALDTVTVTGNGNATGDDGLGLTGLTGAAPITSSNISNNFDSNLTVRNSSGTLNLNVTGGTYSGAGGGQGDGIFVESSGSGSQNLNVQGPITLANNVGDAIQHNGTPSSTADSDVTVDNATISSPTGGGSVLGGGITVVEGAPAAGPGSSNTDVAITDNNIQNSVIGAIAVGTTGTVADQQDAAVDATITGNTIGNAAQAGSGSVQGNGIFVDSNGDGTVRALITQNTIRQWTNRNAIGLDVLDGDAAMDATVQGNVMTAPNTAFAGTQTRGMTLQLGTAQAGDSVDVCLDIGHATTAGLKNQVFGTGESPQPDIRYLHEGPSSAVTLAGYGGPALPTITDISNYLAPRNDVGGVPTVTGNTSPPGSTTTSVASCALPTGP